MKTTAWRLCVALLVVLISVGAFASQPFDYAAQSRNARIKAIAVVEAVEVVENEAAYMGKVVAFKTEHPVTEDTPAVFKGYCRSRDTAEQKRHPLQYHQVFFSPEIGDRIYVTVTNDGGAVTSYTPLSEALEWAIRNRPSAIRYGVSKAHVDRSQLKQ